MTRIVLDPNRQPTWHMQDPLMNRLTDVHPSVWNDENLLLTRASDESDYRWTSVTTLNYSSLRVRQSHMSLPPGYYVNARLMYVQNDLKQPKSSRSWRSFIEYDVPHGAHGNWTSTMTVYYDETSRIDVKL